MGPGKSLSGEGVRRKTTKPDLREAGVGERQLNRRFNGGSPRLC
jgi:hypothetical protein